jgi:ribosomal protein S18 acetylase RimI-like enzyme
MARGPVPDVLKLDRSDRAAAGAVLGRAFHDTDQWTAVLPDGRVRQRKLEQMFTGTVRLVLAAGGVVERTQGFEAIALWLPPGRDIGFWTVVRSGFASARFAVTPPFPSMRRLTAMMRQFDRIHKRHVPDPHWYLMALGVDPAHHRSGYGSTLVRHGIRRADAANEPIYVETESGPNVSFYEALGFEVLDEIVIDAYDLPFTLLIRQPI